MKIPVGEFTDMLGTHELEIDSFHHTFVDGVSGAGKSTFLEDVAIQNIRAGRGIFFLDPHGTSIRRILKYIPRRFSRNVIYFNPLAKKVPGLNFFAFTKKEDRHKAVANLISILKSQAGKHGAIFDHVEPPKVPTQPPAGATARDARPIPRQVAGSLAHNRPCPCATSLSRWAQREEVRVTRDTE
jgi:hypothetical protein